MRRTLTTQERLKDLRVMQKDLKLEELAEQTGLSRSALGSYELNDSKDISLHALVTLAKFYGVSTDYLLCLTENKNYSDEDIASLHLSDETIALLRSGKINNRLLCEIAAHPDFIKLMIDLEVMVDDIAAMKVQTMNTLLNMTRQKIIQEYNPDENDLYLRTLEMTVIDEDDYFAHVLHDDLRSIVHDIRETHRKDPTTADEGSIPTCEQVQQSVAYVSQIGSNTETLIKLFCKEMAIPPDQVTEEEMLVFARLVGKSKKLQKPSPSMRGRSGQTRR